MEAAKSQAGPTHPIRFSSLLMMRTLSLLTVTFASIGTSQAAGWFTDFACHTIGLENIEACTPKPGLTNIPIIEEPLVVTPSRNLIVLSHTYAARLDSIQRVLALCLSHSVTFLRNESQTFEAECKKEGIIISEDGVSPYFTYLAKTIKSISAYNRRVTSVVNASIAQKIIMEMSIRIGPLIYAKLSTSAPWLMAPVARLLAPLDKSAWDPERITYAAVRDLLKDDALRERRTLKELTTMARTARISLQHLRTWISEFVSKLNADLSHKETLDLYDPNLAAFYRLYYHIEDAHYTISVTEIWLLKALSEWEHYWTLLKNEDLAMDIPEEESQLTRSVEFYIRILEADERVLRRGQLVLKRLKDYDGPPSMEPNIHLRPRERPENYAHIHPVLDRSFLNET